MNQIQTTNYHSKIFPFLEALSFLESTGKKLYGQHFNIVDDDHETLFKLLVYFFKDEENANKLGLHLGKGLLLTGPIGCGKTTLMNLLKYIPKPPYQHIVKPCRDVVLEFIDDGFKVIHKYSKRSFHHSSGGLIAKTYCFDDLGAENNFKYYGNECNVMAEILLSRYDLFISQNMLTHATTNLSANELESLYGNRVRSRMRKMFNLIYFDTNIGDKR